MKQATATGKTMEFLRSAGMTTAWQHPCGEFTASLWIGKHGDDQVLLLDMGDNGCKTYIASSDSNDLQAEIDGIAAYLGLPNQDSGSEGVSSES